MNDLFTVRRELKMAMDKIEQLDADKRNLMTVANAIKSARMKIIPESSLYRETQWGNNLIVNVGCDGKSIDVKTQWGCNLIVNMSVSDSSKAVKVADDIYERLSKLIMPNKIAIENFDRYDWDKVVIRGG